MSGKSGKCQGKPFPHKNARELSRKFGPFAMSGKFQGNLNLFTDIQEWRNILKSSFFTLAPLSFLQKYIYMFEQRSTRSMMNVIFVLLAKRVFTDIKNISGGKPQTPSFFLLLLRDFIAIVFPI